MKLKALALALLVAAAPAAASVASHRDPKKRFTPADQAKAKSIVLKPADVGAGWKRRTISNNGNDDLNCPGFDPDLSDLVETGEATSPLFYRTDGSSLFSGATVYPNERTAVTAWSRVVKPALVKCLAAKLERESTPLVTLKTIRSGSLAFPHVAPRTAAFRLGVEVSGPGVKVNVYSDLVAIGRGRVEADFIFSSVRNPFPAAFEQRLARRVAARLKG
jgi:hypothetical protein